MNCVRFFCPVKLVRRWGMFPPYKGQQKTKHLS